MPESASRLPPAMVICGPTAAGKTEIALALARALPVTLISADSVQVYRGMNVGSAKPEPAVLAEFPHALIDLRDPEETYTAADFARDAEAEMRAASAGGRLPVLVGGTAMYLRALRYGLDPLPEADPALRKQLEADAARDGWAALHRRLAELDPDSARRIRVNDPQRIQRALEVSLTAEKPLSALQRGRGPDRMIGSVQIVVAPGERACLHQAINARWGRMLEAGLLDEVAALLRRPGLADDAPALRAVGYRQALDCLRGRLTREEMVCRGAAATRQLAKRQLTAFRQWSGGFWYDPLNKCSGNRIIRRVEGTFRATGAGEASKRSDGPRG